MQNVFYKFLNFFLCTHNSYGVNSRFFPYQACYMFMYCTFKNRWIRLIWICHTHNILSTLKLFAEIYRFVHLNVAVKLLTNFVLALLQLILPIRIQHVYSVEKLWSIEQFLDKNLSENNRFEGDGIKWFDLTTVIDFILCWEMIRSIIQFKKETQSTVNRY